MNIFKNSSKTNVLNVVILLFLLWIVISHEKEPFALDTRPNNPNLSFNKQIKTIYGLPPPSSFRNYYIFTPISKSPSGGFPYVVYYSFIKYDGTNFNKDSSTNIGINSLDNADVCSKGDKQKCNSTSDIWLQMLFHLFIREGIAVVMTTMIADDSYFYLECDKSNSITKKNSEDLYSICWNGNNPDRPYLEKMFDELHNNTLLDNNRMGIMGYSVGAQMVSRSYNDFPLMKTFPNNYSFPKIRVGLMISGGSLHCYQYCNADKKSKLRGPGKYLCNNQPIDYSPCYNKETLGCCPKNLTEPNYDRGKFPWKNHPPTILVQTQFDNFADPNASVRYFNVLQKHNIPSKLITGKGSNHNLFPSAIIPILDFFSRYLFF